VRLLIKYIESRGAGKEVSQFTFEGDIATIGRGTDQTIQIADRRLPLSHSRLTLAGGKLTLASSGDYRFAVNGESTRRAQLQAGDLVEISGHSIKVKADDGELDFVLEVELASETVAKLRDRFQTRLRDVKVPERAIAWTLFLVILITTLAIPMAGFYLDEREELRESMLPDDGQWLSGELHQNHAFLGENCDVCHAKPFVPTQDEDCLGCHQTVTHHFDTEVHGDDYQVGSRCADCHQEHSTTGSIIRSDQGVCTTCHAKLTDVGMDGDGLLPATDFSANHPDFKVSLLQYGLDDDWHEKRVNLDEVGIAEGSNLIFPHDVHLDAAGIDSADGKVQMQCSDCHVPEKGGMKMQAVNMQDHCASCHQLTFDPNSPDRVVPHGSPPELMRTLREYYALQYLTEELGAETDEDQKLAPGTETDADPVRPVRRPGRVERPQLITDLITAMQIDPKASIGAKAAVFIEARVADAAENLFEKQTCTVCHEITAVADAEVPWKVLPVRISEAWYPLSDFSHEGHKNMECDGCHLARDSEVATDILMPDIANCRQCHGGEDAENLLASNCITCHKFHLDDQAPMGNGHGSSVMSDILTARRHIDETLKTEPLASDITQSQEIE
jgi:VCBS repeat-containing protein|tara:strand:- start:3821 stop:5668 length:1848 start_codon:yes stop_codon:yes gene_type:complete